MITDFCLDVCIVSLSDLWKWCVSHCKAGKRLYKKRVLHLMSDINWLKTELAFVYEWNE